MGSGLQLKFDQNFLNSSKRADTPLCRLLRLFPMILPYCLPRPACNNSSHITVIQLPRIQILVPEILFPSRNLFVLLTSRKWGMSGISHFLKCSATFLSADISKKKPLHTRTNLLPKRWGLKFHM